MISSEYGSTSCSRYIDSTRYRITAYPPDQFLDLAHIIAYLQSIINLFNLLLYLVMLRRMPSYKHSISLYKYHLHSFNDCVQLFRVIFFKL